MERLLIILAFVGLLSGCESIVGYDISDHEAQVVVQSIISTNDTWNVELTYSQAGYEDSDPPPVENAEIEIVVEEDDQIIQQYLLADNGNGNYTHGGNPTPGKTYKMSIYVDGQTIEAETYLPKVILEPTIKGLMTIVDGKETVDLEVALGESASDNIYYALDVIKVPKSGNLEADEGETTGDEDDSVGSDYNIKDSDETSINRNPRIYGATPASSDGNGNILVTTRISEATSSADGTPGISVTSSDSEIGSQYMVRIWAISSDYFEYLESISNSDFNPTSEHNPKTVFSNVKNGEGIFAGYSLYEAPIEF